MGEQTEEDGDDERENLTLIRDAVAEKTVAQVVLNYPNEFFLV